MEDSERRKDYSEVIKGIEEIRKILQGEYGDNGLCGRVGKVELRVDQAHKDIKEHKDNHWQVITLAVAVFGIVAGIVYKVL